VRDLVV